MEINTYLLTTALNVNGLNAPIKRHRVANWLKKKERENLYNRLISGKTHILK